MKVKIFAFAALIITVGFVAINTVMVKKSILEVKNAVLSIDNAEDKLSATKDAYKKFKSHETYISLTVNHEDLTNIEDCFAEMIGYLELGDGDGAYVTKSRLVSSLEHLWRLSAINLDSII